MAQDMNIGAARVYLTVDTVDYHTNIARALNAAVGFGTDAERAFDKASGGTKRAAQRLLDYVADLGKTNTELTRFESLLRKASAGGADASVLKAATRAWDDYATNVALTRIETESWERQTKRAAGAARELEQAQRSEAAAAREAANARAKMYVEGRAAQQGTNYRGAIDARLGIDQERSGAYLAEQRRVLEQLTQQADRYAEELERAKQEALGINVAFDQQRAEMAQRSFNSVLGVQSERDPGYLAEQRRVIAALEQQVLVEQQVEAQAREIHQEWSAIERQINAVGKSTYDIMRMNAQQKYGANAAPLIEQINRWEKLNTTMSGSTVNAKQLQQAIRYLPAQFTDIATSLAGGMNPLLVLFQQGGQIFDQFRLSGAGVGDTLRTVGSYALRLVNPLTIALAATAALGAGWYAGAREADGFNRAIQQSGNFAGTTAQQLQLLSVTIDSGIVTQGQAAEVLTKLVTTGKFAGDTLKDTAEAALSMSRLTGQSIEQVISDFSRMAEDPVRAADELIKKMALLTYAQREEIKTLKEQGNEEEALARLMRYSSQELAKRASEVEENTNWMGRSFRNLSTIVRQVIDEIKNVGRIDTEATRLALAIKSVDSAIASAERNMATRQAGGTLTDQLRDNYSKEIERLKAQRASFARQLADDPQQKQAAQQAAQARATATATAFAGELESYKSAEEKRKDRIIAINAQADREIARARAQGLDTLAADIDKNRSKLIAAIEKQGEKKPTGGTSARSAAREVRYEFEAQLAMLRTQARETEASYSLQEISATKYYETLRKLAIQERDIQLASNNAQIEAIQGKKGSEQELARLRAQNVQVEQQYLQREIDLRTQQAQLTKQYNDEYRQLVYSLQDGTEAMRQQMEMEAISLGMSDKQFGRLQARIEIERDRERQLRELDRRVEENANFAEEAERRKAAVIEETNKKLAMQADLYGYIDVATGNWLTGAEKAWQEWLDQVGDVSGKAFNFFSTAFDGLADLTTDFLTGSEANWKDYLNNLGRMITRFVVEQQLTKWMQSLKVGGDSGGGVMGFVGNLFGALLGSGGNPNTVSYAPGGSFTWNPAVRPFAAGGIPGAAGLSAYRNQVVSSPTLFPFAAGGVPNWGLMGEAGREAIVPLTRMPGGDLGVKMDTRGGQRGPVTLNQTFVVQGTPDRSTQAQLAAKTGREAQRAISRN